MAKSLKSKDQKIEELTLNLKRNSFGKKRMESDESNFEEEKVKKLKEIIEVG